MSPPAARLAGALVGAAALVLAGCPPVVAPILVPPDRVRVETREGYGGRRYRAETWADGRARWGPPAAAPWARGAHVYYPVTPDSFNVQVEEAARRHPFDVLDVELRAGGRLRHRALDGESVRVRADSLVFRAGGGPVALPLAAVSRVVVRDAPSAADRLVVAGVVVAAGAVLAVLPPSSRSNWGEAGESALIGAGVALPLGVLLGWARADPARRAYWVAGFDGP